MSFLTRITPLATRLSLNSTSRTTPAFAVAASRSISSTVRNQEGAVKDTIKKADRTVSDAAVKGIEKGEQVTDKLKDSVGIKTEKAKAKAEHMKGEAAEVAGQGKGKAEQAVGEAAGKTEEALGEAKGKAKEVTNKISS